LHLANNNQNDQEEKGQGRETQNTLEIEIMTDLRAGTEGHHRNEMALRHMGENITTEIVISHHMEDDSLTTEEIVTTVNPVETEVREVTEEAMEDTEVLARRTKTIVF